MSAPGILEAYPGNRPVSRADLARMAIGIALGAVVPGPAAAHVGTGLPGGFLSGFVHPCNGIDHLLAMVSVGLWGAFLGRPLLYVLPIIFPGMMAAGAVLGMFALPMPPVEMGVAFSVLILGSCIALSISPPVWVASLIVALFATFHGYAHGQELPSAADPAAYSAGFVVATGLLHVSGIGLGYLNQLPNGILATRGIGVAIAVVGGVFLHRAIGS